jgi:hypothetical protein
MIFDLCNETDEPIDEIAAQGCHDPALSRRFAAIVAEWGA